MALCWAGSCKSVSSVYWGAQHWIQHSRCNFLSTGQRGRITSLNLLATFSPMQPRSPSVSPKHDAGSYSAWCPSGLDPHALFRQAAGASQLESNYWCRGLFLLSCRTAFPTVKLCEVPDRPILLLVQVPLNCSTPVWCTSHSFCCVICDLAEGALCAIIWVVKADVEQDWPQYQSLGAP